MNQTTITPGRTVPPMPDLIHELRAQRIRISALSRKLRALRGRRRNLLTESKSLTARIEQSCTNLAGVYLKTKSTFAELRLGRSANRCRVPLESPANVPELVVADSPDLVEALEQATEILKMGFSDTEGRGLDTIVKCERVLQRTRSTCTLELALY